MCDRMLQFLKIKAQKKILIEMRDRIMRKVHVDNVEI